MTATDLLELHLISRAGYVPTSAWLGVSVGKLWNALHGRTKLARGQHADLAAHYLELITTRMAQVCQAFGR